MFRRVRHQTVRMNSKGEQVHVLLSIFPTFHDGEITGWDALLNDISEHKEAEQRLLQSEKLAAIGQMAASIAHEIKNPLTTLSGFLDLLLSSPPNKQEMYIHIMTTEMQRITEIVNEMLVLAKPQQTDYQLINLTEVLSGVFTLLQPEATMRNVNFNLTLSEQVQNVTVFGHENRLKQLFINVILNSLEALNGEPGKVSVSLRPQGDSCLVEVRDTGGGMTPEQIAHLGEPFKTTKEKGTGLGLLVSKQIVEQHHGNIEFISELERGTTVRISLPLSHAKEATQL